MLSPISMHSMVLDSPASGASKLPPDVVPTVAAWKVAVTGLYARLASAEQIVGALETSINTSANQSRIHDEPVPSPVGSWPLRPPESLSLDDMLAAEAGTHCVPAGELLYPRVPKFWTHRTKFYCFCDTSVRDKAWRSHTRVAQAT